MARKHSETPPYVPRKGLVEVFDVIALHKKGDVITRDELHKRGVSSHLIYPAIAALRYLGLIDESGTLLGGHEAFSRENCDKELQKEIVKRSYSEFFENVPLPLKSENEAEKKFQEVYNLSERLMKSSFPLFYFLATESGIEIIKGNYDDEKKVDIEEKVIETKEEKREEQASIPNDVDVKIDEGGHTHRQSHLQFVISLQVNKFTTEKDIMRMVRTAKKAIHLIKKSGDY